ncbi:hypothetical protein [Streptomyces sp. NPDC048845]|uniref:SCO2102 family sporulation regulator n=1 Tax=Streptomyces sp. NPDC048845 TaxID=3155390 RepID=UPI00343FAA28
MGWTVLYIAFGVVALWLLGEVLLQYKARLRWRVLAFAGFSGVVVGVLMPSVVVIAVGAMAFAVGQTYVTLSFRRGFSTGWAIGGKPGASRRRKEGTAPSAEPTLEVSGIEESVPGQGGYPAGPDEPVHRLEPMPDDTGEYGVYRGSGYGAPHFGDRPAAAAGVPGGRADTGGFAGYDDGYGSYVQHDAAAASWQTGYDTGGYPGGYDQQTEQGYAPYSDPYIGSQQYDQGYAPYGGQQYGGQPYGAPDPSYPADPYPAQTYGADPYAGDPYAAQHPDTPPGGVWVPQQRDPGYGYPQPPADPPVQQPYPYQAPPGYSSDYDEQQYRY